MQRTRRSLLAAGAAVGVGGVAGCLGGGDGDGGGGELTLDPGAYDCDPTEPDDPTLDYRPTLGDPDADVVVRVFEDFTCGHCATYTLDHFPTVREEYVAPGDVRYEHWDFPIPVDEQWAVPVASAARGVGVRQGDEAFFEFAAAAYESQGSYGEGEAAGGMPADADPCAVLADAEFATYEEAALSDREAGLSMGVDATPAILVNGSPVEGYDADAIGAAIESEL